MKAIEILDWICKDSIEGETISTIYVPATDDEWRPQDKEWWVQMFGYAPSQPIPSGTYLYYYSGSHDEIRIDGKMYKPDAIIHIEENEELIYLYKVED